MGNNVILIFFKLSKLSLLIQLSHGLGKQLVKQKKDQNWRLVIQQITKHKKSLCSSD